MTITLEKRLESAGPQLVSLAKKAEVSLKKANLTSHRAKVALCLDISGSMSGLYRSGKIQRLAEKVLALGTRFDDDGAIDIFLFGEKAHNVGEMNLENFRDFLPALLKRHPLEAGTCYGKAIRLIRQHYFPEGRGERQTAPVKSEQPVYVLFLTDGQTSDERISEEQLRWGAYEPIFWQFIGIGKSNKDVKKTGIAGFFSKLAASDFSFLERLDTMDGRYVDNANFFSLEDPEQVSDESLFDLLMGEYPSWVQEAPRLALLP